MCIRRRLFSVWIGLLISISAGLITSDSVANEASFPTDGESWINTQPITPKGLGNKAAFLWFFEES